MSVRLEGVRAESAVFEDEVRRIARNLWPAADTSGPLTLAGQERDALFVTEEMVHLIEATTSRQRDKAKTDAEKLAKAVPKLQQRYPTKGVKGWLITRDAPTAEQVQVTRRYAPFVVVQSFDQFRSQLVDARDYVMLRRQYSFGSAQNPATNSVTDLPEYVPLDVVRAGAGTIVSTKEIAAQAAEGDRLLLVGDFGAGKSMSLRDVFMKLSGQFLKSEIFRFPIHVNLRDHHGQTDTAEALERHARSIGFAHPSHVVRAWRSGTAHLLLDGFDELGSAGWTGSTRRMGAVRHAAMTLVRNFICEAPSDTGVVIAGRQHFFDSDREMKTALGLSTSFEVLTLNEFTDEQVVKYLSRMGWREPVPQWLPGRPLLLGYLATRGFLQDVLSFGSELAPAQSWDQLLDRICDREALIEVNVDGQTVRLIIERLATMARTTPDGLGRFTFDEIGGAFADVCGYRPDDRGAVLLQRLPGLGVRDVADNSRQFIDDDLVDAARAGEVRLFLFSPHSFRFSPDPSDWATALGDLGVELDAHRLSSGGVSPTLVGVAIRHAQETEGWGTLTGDLIRIALATGAAVGDGSNVYVRGADIPSLEFDRATPDLAGVQFQDSLIHHLEIDRDAVSSSLPKFVRCLIGRVEGRVGPNDLPIDRFEECEFGTFAETTATTAGIMKLEMNAGVRVALTILKKLYLQRGKGRKENALSRGLDHESKRLVPDILRIIERHDLGTKSRAGAETIWLPTRAEAGRVHQLLASPDPKSDAFLQECDDI